MSRQYFGTDGIRARVNAPPMTADTALRLAIAAARVFAPDAKGEVVIGRDTRGSGQMIEAALVAGLASMGLVPIRLGIVPTPAVAMMARERAAVLGLMVTASHNTYRDNGIKLFSSAGIKLTDDEEEAVERAMAHAFDGPFPEPEAVRVPAEADGAGELYIQRCLSTLADPRPLARLKVVIDCAHGAAFRTAPAALSALGIDLYIIGAEPDGMNINAGFGSTATSALKAAVLERGADVGLAFDGDADRLVVIDERGKETDGDQVLALIATELHQTGRLRGGGIVATVMSNIGLDRYLASHGLRLARTPVGDRHVGEHMRRHGFNLGGETSGHIILSDVSTTGDGLLAGLNVLSVLASRHAPASETLRVFQPAPQKLVNVRYTGANPLEQPAVKEAVAEAESMLAGTGRLVVRKSGTEPLVRVMAEAMDEALMERALARVVSAVETAV